jgi:hypothetical protein
VSAEYSSQPEDESATINPSESIAKRQRITEYLPVEEQMVKEQEKHNTAPKEEPRPMKRPVAADYFDHPEGEPTTTNSDEPLSKKQRIASIKICNASNADHIRSSNTDVYISARKSMTVRTYIHSKSKRTEAIALLDSGATENFMELKYAEWLQLPIKRLPEPRQLVTARYLGVRL